MKLSSCIFRIWKPFAGPDRGEGVPGTDESVVQVEGLLSYWSQFYNLFLIRVIILVGYFLSGSEHWVHLGDF